jgi:hypothetical protein
VAGLRGVPVAATIWTWGIRPAVVRLLPVRRRGLIAVVGTRHRRSAAVRPGPGRCAATLALVDVDAILIDGLHCALTFRTNHVFQTTQCRSAGAEAKRVAHRIRVDPERFGRVVQ